MTTRDADLNKLGTTLRTARLAHGLSLRALARAADVDFGYISYLEDGTKRRPSPEIVRRLAAVLELDTEELAALATGSPLPTFAPYLRAKYDLPAEAVDELKRLFDEVSRQYRKKGGRS